MAARLAASPGAGPVLPRPAKTRPNLDHSRYALSCPSMSLLDLSKWHGARSFWETRPLMPWTVGPRVSALLRSLRLPLSERARRKKQEGPSPLLRIPDEGRAYV